MMLVNVIRNGRAALCAVALGFLVVGCASPIDEKAGSPSDADIVAQVSQRLAVEPAFRERLFNIEASDGSVTIRGIVSSEAERMRLLSIVRGTPGVANVIDRMRVIR